MSTAPEAAKAAKAAKADPKAAKAADAKAEKPPPRRPRRPEGRGQAREGREGAVARKKPAEKKADAAKRSAHAEGRLAQVLVAPIVSEKATMRRREAQPGAVQGAARRDQARDQGRGRADVQGRGRLGADRAAKGQGQALRPFDRPPRPRQEGVRVAEGRARSSTSPGRPRNGRHQSQADVARPPCRRQGRASAPVQGPARGVAARAADAERRPQQQRPHHDAPQGRRSQAPLPRRRFRAQQGRHPGEGRAHRVRPEPHAPTSRWCATPTASAATSSPRAASRSARRSLSGAEAPIKAGNTLPIRNIPVGSIIHCIEMLPGKGAQIARSAGAVGDAAGARRHLRAAAPALGRSAQDPHRLPRHDRRGVATKSTACASTARPARSAGRASARRFAASR